MHLVCFVRKDLGCWLKKNCARLLLLLLLCVFAVVIAVRNAVAEDAQIVFEESGSTLFGFLRDDVGIVNVLFKLLFEWSLMLCYVFLCMYNDITAHFSCFVVAYRAYTSFYNIVVVARACVLSGMFFCITYMFVVAMSLLTLAFVAIEVVDLQYRYRYGLSELKSAVRSFLPTLTFIGLLILIELILICFSKIFI